MTSETKNLLNSYLAGVMDSDGSFSICKRKRKGNKFFYRTVAQLTWKNTEKSKEIFDELLREYGGKYHIIKSRGFSKKGTTFLKYNLEGDSLVYLLQSIIPYLRLKKRQAEIVIELKLLRKKWLGKTRGPWDKPSYIWEEEEKLYLENLLLNTKNGGKGRGVKNEIK